MRPTTSSTWPMAATLALAHIGRGGNGPHPRPRPWQRRAAARHHQDPPRNGAPTRPTSKRGWRVLYYGGCLALIAIGALIGLVGLIKVQGVLIPLNIELREGCLADPSLVDPREPCPHQAEAILRYPDGRTEVIRGTPLKVDRRVARITDKLVAAERSRGLGYLLVATLLVEGGIAAIAWQLVRGRRQRSRRTDQPGRDHASSPAG
jgi:hypothetical protein